MVMAPKFRVVPEVSPAVRPIVPPPRPIVTAPSVCDAASPAFPMRLKLPPERLSAPPATAPGDISDFEVAAMPLTYVPAAPGLALATKWVASVTLTTYWFAKKGAPESTMPDTRPAVELTVTVVDVVRVWTIPSVAFVTVAAFAKSRLKLPPLTVVRPV